MIFINPEATYVQYCIDWLFIGCQHNEVVHLIFLRNGPWSQKG